ncbi:MAG: tRNA (adenosine(37)-N6)-threonylcarbamoyltransferase complex ATPase subunit type 1 TsaE [Kangiellaceae bacterium]|nr:tRNA (adenosine(37)-N6)-threonylcarbamoyltransferase complex ATPase subunit type 1 TsaE [Kangiellaceae bacterium]MCW8999086.1 tRNA (adenosine(37)-N6)-threonylcarbamoyltransferase complex ATPase subunit type 1 TsaE [Kangiellaceae bacterium]MCW9016945.1 tRNA (adenosine(37)-N6)-threonylcarbamoyltransferase complex ATPase subunit type 1 TsaE [Kangiellaceae bacterium]
MHKELLDEKATLEFGCKLAGLLPQKAVIFLNGPLGAGKTTMVRGLLQALGHSGSTKSPTYTLVEPYEIGGRKVYHFDLYRLGDPEELEYIGIRDYLDEAALCLIEWPEKGTGILPEADISLELSYQGEARSIRLDAGTASWSEALVEKLLK